MNRSKTCLEKEGERQNGQQRNGVNVLGCILYVWLVCEIVESITGEYKKYMVAKSG